MDPNTAERLPVVIQGGMGVGVSAWRLARAVARAGHLGVVSGTALDVTLARRLQDGDVDGSARRALAHFPLPEVAARVLDRWFRPEGRPEGKPYKPTPRPGLRPNLARDELTVAGNFVEVWLAKEGHDGLIGINFLEKIQVALPAAAYGAVLAGADYVLVGAGIPRLLPSLLTELSAHRPGTIQVDVTGGPAQPVTLDPAELGAGSLAPMRRPRFLAIVSAHVLAAYLARDPFTRPDGFVVEGPSAGGHNAPPRGRLVVDESGEPVYGPRDDANLEQIATIGLPFWLAGGYGEPGKVRAALAAGAAGVQVGTLFALCRESGLLPPLREQLLEQLRAGTLQVRTDMAASPTGFPFKVAQIPDTMAEASVYAARPRLCDLGYLRQAYQRPNGTVGFRCPAEPVDMFARKGGDPGGAVGSKCLCNALVANIGLGQHRADGYDEAPIITLGSDLHGARLLDAEHWLSGGSPEGWSATDAVSWLMREAHAPAAGTQPVITGQAV